MVILAAVSLAAFAFLPLHSPLRLVAAIDFNVNQGLCWSL